MQLDDIGNLLSGKAATNNVVLSLTESAQRTAAERRWRTSAARWSRSTCRPAAVVAMYSNPTFNPNGLSVHDTQVVQTTFNQINSGDKAALPARLPRPLLAGFDVQGGHEQVGDRGRARDAGRSGVPRSRTVSRSRAPTPTCATSAAAPCGGTLAESLIDSCNATFAQLGYELGDAFAPAMEQCGINSAPPIDLAPKAEKSVGPLVGARQGPLRARGHRAGRRVHHAAADGADRRGDRQRRRDHGAARRARRSRTADGQTVRTIEPEDWTTCMSAHDRGCAHEHDDRRRRTRAPARARTIDGVEVAGKTGTAQTGVEGENPHAWFIAFAPAERTAVRGRGDRRARRRLRQRGHRWRGRRPDRQAAPAEPVGR